MLRIWLPLTKDLRQQGLSDVTVTNNGATFDSAGKLGGCYSFNASGYLKETSFDWTNFNTSEFSLCCWYKEPSPVASGNSQMICIGTSSGWNNIRIGLLRRFSNGYPMFSVSDGTNNVNYNFTADSFALDVWNHIVCTYNNGTMKMYLNGVLHKTSTTTIVPVLNSSQHLGIGAASNGAEPLTGYLNDVRIYDHCLSPMEVKELAKGLVLHYPLADAYVEATTNLSNSKLSSSCYNAVTQKYSYGTNTDIYKESGTFEGRACEKVHMGTNGLDAFPYVFFDYFQPPIGKTRTLSFDYYPTIMDKVVFYTYNSPGNGNYTINYKAPVSWSGSVTIPVQLNQWNHITITVTNTGSAANGYGYMQIGNVKHTSNTANYWLFGNIQVEAKDHATGYVGPNGTRSAGTVYDCSGFCNNGTISGNLVISNDTPKYAVSTTINSSKIQCITNPITGDDPIFSIGFWFKLKSNISYIAYADLVSFSSSSYSNQPFRLEICGNPVGNDICWFRGPSGNTGGFKINTSSLVRDTWYHTVLVSEGSKQYSYYINGVKTGTYNGSANSWTPTNIFCVGDGQAGAFDMSDVRIYATALSASDVKSLYQNSAYIDSSGNVYGAVHSEV